MKRLPPFSAVDQCPVTSTYMGIWRWDVTIYMVFAEIKIFQGGQLAGQASYDSQKGGLNLGKFIKAEPKIRELVSELLPPAGRTQTALSQMFVATPSQATVSATSPAAPVARSAATAPAIVTAPPVSTAPPATSLGQSAFTVERLAKDNQSCTAPVASLTAKGAGFETYTVKCSSGDAISFRCELGNCRILQ